MRASEVSLGTTTNAMTVVAALLQIGNLNGAISLLDQLIKANPTNKDLATMRIRLGLLRLEVVDQSQTNAPSRIRTRKHLTQLPQIDQLSWAAIEQRTRELTRDTEVNIPRTAIEGLLADVRVFMLEQPDFLAGWLLQARLALLLNADPEGFSAAYNLDQLGAWETLNPTVLHTLQQLEQHGWWLTLKTNNQ